MSDYNIEDILRAFNEAKAKYKPISNFYREVWGNLSENDHTRILLAILRTEVNGSLPFLDDFCKSFEIEVNLTAVKREDIHFNKHYCLDSESFIDGLILPSNKDFVIIIENKVCGAYDQEDQIDRYIHCCKEEKVSIENIWTIYITADGTLHNGSPTKNSLKDYADEVVDRLLCLNYKQDLLPWLRRIKYNLKASLYSCIDSYIEYLELMFQEDIVSRQADNDLKIALGITNQSLQERHSRLKSILSKIDNNPISEFVDLRSTIVKYINEIEQPYWDKFYDTTIDYFKSQNHSVLIKKLRYNKEKGYIQIRNKEWDYRIHYEWLPISFEKLFLEQDSLYLYIHIEGKGKYLEAKKESKIPPSYEITRNECGMSMILNGSFEEWLYGTYNEIVDSWNTLEEINKKLKNGAYNTP